MPPSASRAAWRPRMQTAPRLSGRIRNGIDIRVFFPGAVRASVGSSGLASAETQVLALSASDQACPHNVSTDSSKPACRLSARRLSLRLLTGEAACIRTAPKRDQGLIS